MELEQPQHDRLVVCVFVQQQSFATFVSLGAFEKYFHIFLNVISLKLRKFTLRKSWSVCQHLTNV
jgi:hypothetical protein